MMSRAQRDAAFSGLCAGQSALVHWRTQPTGTIHIGAGTIAALIAAAAAAQWLDGPVDLAPSLKLPVHNLTARQANIQVHTRELFEVIFSFSLERST
jgi:coproporphyrinogen III oxidase